MINFIKKSLNWIFGIFFLLYSLSFRKESFIASFLFFLISIFFIPKTFLLIKEKIKIFNLETFRLTRVVLERLHKRIILCKVNKKILLD